jgi:Trk-type K+ transport system membrane component
MALMQIIIGGIGFPLIYDVIEKIKHKRKGLTYKLTLFTKVAVSSYFIIAVLTAAAAFGFEFGYSGFQYAPVIASNGGLTDSTLNVPIYDIAHYKEYAHEFGKVPMLNKCWAIFFNSMSTRSAGLGTVNQGILAPGSQWLYIVTMFIGGSPSSTAGGIRTTTLCVIVLTIVAKVKGHKDVNVFKKKIPEATIREALLVTLTAIMLVSVSAIIIFYALTISNSTIPEKYTVLQCVYEATSAFGTVGFSMGITSYINHFGQIILCLVMFTGQLGISSTLLS